jgi:hypothetical protein
MSERTANGVVAEFADADSLLAAARRSKENGFAPIDALSPYRLAGIEEALALPQSTVRWPMAIFGLGAAVLAYGVEAYSAVFAYPINAGGRPLNSWPVFLLVPFEVGVLAAAAAGFVAFLCLCRLPRLNQPIFDIEGVERATTDRFFLLFSAPSTEQDGQRLTALLEQTRALRIEGARR